MKARRQLLPALVLRLTAGNAADTSCDDACHYKRHERLSISEAFNCLVRYLMNCNTIQVSALYCLADVVQ